MKASRVSLVNTVMFFLLAAYAAIGVAGLDIYFPLSY